MMSSNQLNINIMNIKNFIVVYLIVLSFCGFGQQQERNYNLDFEYPLSGSSWWCIFDNFRVEPDSLNKVNGSKSILISRSYLKKEFNLSIYQIILLPRTVKNVQASIFAQCDQFFSAELNLIAFDNKRNVMSRDSNSIISNGMWRQFTTTVNSKIGIDIIMLEIRATENFIEKKKCVKLWIDNLQIMLDGIDLHKYKDTVYQLSDAEYNDISSNSKLTPLLEIPYKELKTIDAKIIGFGETVHGSKEISKSIFSNIRKLVTDHNCRLVLLEIPIDLGIRLNQYVHQEIFDEDINALISGLHIDNEELFSFLNWIQNYNSKNDNKVSIFGIDNYSGYSPRHINNFLLSKKCNSSAIDSLLGMINSYNYRSIPLKFAEKHTDQFRAILGDQHYFSLIQYLKNRTDSLCRIIPLFQSNDWHTINRDFLLWQNAKFAIDNFSADSSKVAIYSHLSHLNKNTPIFLNSVKSLGQYIAEFYISDFYLIGMLVNEGTIFTLINPNRMISLKIEPPEFRSIEYICSLTNETYFYKTLPLLSSFPILYRHIGAYYSKNRQFDPSFTKGSLDAIVYIKKSTESTINPTMEMQGRKVYDLYNYVHK